MWPACVIHTSSFSWTCPHTSSFSPTNAPGAARPPKQARRVSGAEEQEERQQPEGCFAWREETRKQLYRVSIAVARVHRLVVKVTALLPSCRGVLLALRPSGSECRQMALMQTPRTADLGSSEGSAGEEERRAGKGSQRQPRTPHLATDKQSSKHKLLNPRKKSALALPRTHYHEGARRGRTQGCCTRLVAT